MKSTLEYLDEAKKACKAGSDNAFGLSIGITRASMNSYKMKRTIMDDYTCIRVAGILKINPMEVIAAANYEREKSEEKKEFWLNFMKQYARSTAAMVLLQCIILTSCLSYSDPAQAIDLQRFSVRENVQSITIIRNFVKLLSGCFEAAFSLKAPPLRGFFTISQAVEVLLIIFQNRNQEVLHEGVGTTRSSCKVCASRTSHATHEAGRVGRPVQRQKWFK